VLPTDIEALAAFEAQHMHFPMGFHIQEWLRGDHPTSARDGFTLVEETGTGAIVSAACLLPQRLTYEGIPFVAGRAEAVATRPDHRRRGLVRAQFKELHRWAEAQGQQVQIVEGATWLYRDFGYQPALDNNGGMNSGGRAVYRHQLPRLATDKPEPFSVRLVTAPTIGIGALVEQQTHRVVAAR
jgi:GNAT superfamily N-acetyltransferase